MSSYKKYLLKKVIWYGLTLCLAVSLNFILPRLLPGNPVNRLLSRMSQGVSDTSSMKAQLDGFMADFSLDQPLPKQFLIYVGNLFQGNLGRSLNQYPRPVGDMIAKALPWTLILQIPALITGWLIGNILGAYAAYKKGLFDRILFPVSLFISSIPFFIFSIICLYLFAVVWPLFPSGGGYGIMSTPGFSWEFISSAGYHYLLPFASIVLVGIGSQGIGMRSMSIYELNTDYVKYSKLMGLKESKIITYVFRNAMLPQITGLGMSLGTSIAGGFITEMVFNYPGLGKVMLVAIQATDYPVISAVTLMLCITVLLANFALDIVYGLIDPRIKAAQMEGN